MRREIAFPLHAQSGPPETAQGPYGPHGGTGGAEGGVVSVWEGSGGGGGGGDGSLAKGAPAVHGDHLSGDVVVTQEEEHRAQAACLTSPDNNTTNSPPPLPPHIRAEPQHSPATCPGSGENLGGPDSPPSNRLQPHP